MRRTTTIRTHTGPQLRRLLAPVVAIALVTAACAPDEVPPDEAPAEQDTPPVDAPGQDDAADAIVPAEPTAFPAVDAPALGSDFEDFGEDGLDRWEQEVPGIEDVTITSSLDDEEQPSLYLAPTGNGEQPLLVVAHSWSTGYTQHLGIPFARWAAEAGWGFVHPDFRGVNERPESTGSPLAVQDVVDAVDDAIERGGIDPDRVYVLGFSGGGMMSLLLAGQHPDVFAGAVAWVPVEDLETWYVHNVEEQPEEAYAEQIEASCGGDPTSDAEARDECATRSPSAHLAGARDAGIPIYIGHGLDDPNVPPDHGVRAFDALAADEDQLGAEVVEELAAGRLPPELDGEVEAPTGFGDDDPTVRFARTSGPTTFVLFDGEHDLVFEPGLAWLWTLAEGEGR